MFREREERADVRDRDPALGPTTPVPVPDPLASIADLYEDKDPYPYYPNC